MEHEVNFVNHQGHKLYGVLVDHDQGTTDKVIILCHGMLAHSAWKWIPTLSHVLCQRLACRVLRFDFSGNGRSEGPWNFGAYRSQVQDLGAAIEYLKGQGLKPVAIIGHSFGADVALLYATSADPLVHFIVNISGRFNMQLGLFDRFSEAQLHDLYEEGSFYWRILNRTLIVTKESIDERLGIVMGDEVKKIPDDITVLTVHGTNDEIVHINDARQWQHYIKNHILMEVEGSDHNFTGGSHTSMINLVVQWLYNQIGGRPVVDEVDLTNPNR